MQLVELKILSVLAEERNMRKAADRLFVSQPALSQRLQSIEREWETAIFLRSKRGLTITPAGEKIIAYANETLKREEKVREEISSLQARVYGTLKLAVASATGQYWLPNRLKRFVERFPQVKISLVTGWSSEVLNSMYEDDAHIGIIRGNPEWKGEKIHLFSDPLYLVDTTISSLDELEGTEKPFIQFQSDSTYYQQIQDWWYMHYQTRPSRTIVVDQIETCKEMAIHGIGYAILPKVSLTPQDTHLHKIPLIDRDRKPIQRETWLLTHAHYRKLKQVREFIELAETR
ncbi:MAG TPA: LysR family transcriptional regulator [Bacillales bacterium]|nr:LysR family transcriptional regulator [Bacillales bacterium]